MRITKLALASVIAVMMLAGTAYAQGLNGTAHDLRSRLGISEVCVVCHAPHNAIAPLDGPIWNHELTTQTFTRHGETVTIAHSSKLCLSCHDGVTAVGNFNGITDSTDTIIGAARIGTDLTDDHPIGIAYADANTHIFYPESDVAGYLEAGNVECGSCHYAHGGQDGKFLRVTKTDSAICRVCHTF